MIDSRTILNNDAQCEGEKFNTDSISYTQALIISSAKRKLILWYYHRMVAQKKIIQLEDTTEESKRTLWDDCRIICDNKLSKPDLVDFSMCMYAMIFISENKVYEKNSS